MVNLYEDINEKNSCDYQSVDDFQNLIKNSKEVFSSLSLNIRSLKKNFYNFRNFIRDISTDQFQFSVIGLQEIWSKSNIKLNNYHPLISNERTERRGGGVGFYIKSDLKFQKIDNLSLFDEGVFESICLKIFCGKDRYRLVANFYRPPNSSIKDFNNKMNDFFQMLELEQHFKNAVEVILLGDFNCNLINHETHKDTNDFLNLFLSNSFLPLITLPSRVTDTSSTLIDNIWTNAKHDKFSSGLLLEHLSDHLPIFYLQVKDANKRHKENEIIRNLSDKNRENFREELLLYNWDPILSDNNPKSAFDSFAKVIKEKYDYCFPYIELRKNRRKFPDKPWMTKDLLIHRIRKDDALKDRVKEPSDENKFKFKDISKAYNKNIRKAKDDYYEGKFEEHVSNSKKTWSLINEVIQKNKNKNSMPSIFYDEFKSYESALDIANGFNDFFVNIGPKLAQAIPQSGKDYKDFLSDPIRQNFVFANVTHDIIYDALNRLQPKKSAGLDGISMAMLKEIMPCIIIPVTYLFNLSFKTGFIPQEYKCAKVIPIYKSGEMSKFDNYRPISILPAFSKLLEKIAAVQMVRFLEKYEILYSLQFGFRPKHDTTQPLLQLVHKVFESLNKPNSEYTLSVFIDLKKAFDTVNIPILLDKLKRYGFRNKAHDWFTSYLTDRSQYVSIDNVTSSLKNITHGVPQGSVLGPILFLLYINDLHNATLFYTLLFADDTSFLLSGRDLNELYALVNTELEKAFTWFKANKLSLNVSKTKYLVFRSPKMPLNVNLSIKIGNEEVERIGQDCQMKSFKFVGIMIDEFLSWDYHINHVANKISSSIFALKQVKNILPMKIKKLLYNAMVKPHLEYGLLVWGQSKQLTRVEKLQKKALRLVSNASYNAHTEPIFGNQKLLKIGEIYTVGVNEFASKYLNNKIPKSSMNLLNPLGNERTKNLRPPIPKNKHLETFPSVRIPQLWNKLPIADKSLTSPSNLKSKLSNLHIDKYKNFICNKRPCYPCNRT